MHFQQCSWCADPKLPLYPAYEGAEPLESMTYPLPGHDGITRSARGTNVAENLNLYVELAMSNISGVALTMARLLTWQTTTNFTAGIKNKGDPDYLLKDPVRMNILEAAAKKACLPRLFPEHNMQPLAVKEYMLTDALNPPLDRPELPAAMTTEQLRSSGKLASWTHDMTEQEEDEATELLLTMAMINGKGLHSCEVAAQMSCAHALLFMHKFCMLKSYMPLTAAASLLMCW